MRILDRSCALVLVLFIAACGGSGSTGSDVASPPPPPPPGPDVPGGPAPNVALATVTGAPEIAIDSYDLVSSTRISRTVFEYTYHAVVSNWGDAPASLGATLTSSAASTIVVDGDVSFGDVERGATVPSTDTFTIRQDRSLPFDESALTWTVQSTPLAPTTLELIDAALASGAIDAETALVYKVFNEFHDARLPVQYRGREVRDLDAGFFQQAVDRFDTLSPQTQALLRPFTLPPDDPESWLATGTSSATAATRPRASMAAPSESAARVRASSVGPVESLPGGAERVLVANKVYVYWHDQRDAGLGITIADAIDQDIWPKLTALLGEPPYDHTGTLQVHLASATAMTLFYQQVTGQPADPNAVYFGLTGPACHPNIPVVYLNRDVPANIVPTAAHEITHAILARFPLSKGCADRTWLAEATASWAEHFVYPAVDTEHPQAPNFLNEPTDSLECLSSSPAATSGAPNNCPARHEYGAYLWFLFTTRGDKSGTSNASTQRVLNTWTALAQKDSLNAVNDAVADRGGLPDQWPEFALYNWNRVHAEGKPYVYYKTWDDVLHSARESTTAAATPSLQPPKVVKLDGATFKGYPLAHKINHLGAKYWHFDFKSDPNIRRVRVTHPYAGGAEPTAKVQVLVKRKTGDWKPVEDWTGYERRTLCRDKPDEDFDELVVVISDSEFNNRNHVLDDSGVTPGSGTPRPIRTFVEVSAFGCTNWTGSVDFSVTQSGGGTTLSETGHATGLVLKMSFDRFTRLGYSLEGGKVAWHHTGSYNLDDGDSCSGDSQGEYPLTPALPGVEWIGDFGGCCAFSSPVVPAYNLLGVKSPPPSPEDYTCHDAQEPYEDYLSSPLPGHEGRWLNFGDQFISPLSPTLYDSDPLGNSLDGLSTIIEQVDSPTGVPVRKTYQYQWHFQKSDTFPDEPEL